RDGTLSVHLNGFIDRLNADTLWDEFKLTDSSYASTSLLESPWITAFRQDLRIARAIFYLGYSLSDLDVKRVLFDSESLVEKSFFVLRSGEDTASNRRARKYGNVIKSTVSEFAGLVEALKDQYEPKDLTPGSGYAVRRFHSPQTVREMSDRY